MSLEAIRCDEEISSDFEVIKEKAKELFEMCDASGKGFINKDDMQCLQASLQMSGEELFAVFEKLDYESRGFLTFDEFCAGFGEFLQLAQHAHNVNDQNSNSESMNDIKSKSRDLDHVWGDLAEESSDKDSLKELGQVLSLDQELEHSHSLHKKKDVQEDFETTIDISKQLIAVKKEKEEIERVLRERSILYAKHVEQLSEEMEEQIKQGKQNLCNNEVMQERSVSLQLKLQLEEKEESLSDVTSRQKLLEEQVSRLNKKKVEVTNENTELQQLNKSLVVELENTRDELQKTLLLVKDIEIEKSELEEAMRREEELQNAEAERKNLLNEVEALREHNRRLQDDRDEAFQLVKKSIITSPFLTSTPEISRSPLTLCEVQSQSFWETKPNREGLEDNDVDPEYLDATNSKISPASDARSEEKLNNVTRENSSSIITTDQGVVEEHHPQFQNFYRKLSQVPDGCSSSGSSSNEEGERRGDGSEEPETNSFPTRESTLVPDRVYKVVLVGDSGVGKTSCIRKFVSGTFKHNYSSTIGVDFQIKTMNIEGQLVVLQLWDTAGQERFHSITRQYFRKADAVVVIYDITNEKSFLAVRNWMQSAQDGADSSVVLLLLGNKVDKSERKVDQHEGKRLAEEHWSQFFEISAKSGQNINESMASLSKALAKSEDGRKEDIYNLSKARSSSSCCLGKSL